MWRTPNGHQSWMRLLYGPVSFLYSFTIILLSCPPNFDHPPEFAMCLNTIMGWQIAFGQIFFINWKSDDLMDIFQGLNSMDRMLMKRGESDLFLKRIRNSYYVSEMFLMIFGLVLMILSVTLYFLQIPFIEPVELLLNMQLLMDLQPFSYLFWLSYFLQLIAMLHLGVCISTPMFMIGNIYSQLILHIEVLDYDIEMLDEDEAATSEEMLIKFREFIITYQALVELLNKCRSCMRWLFINLIVANMIVITVSCIEFTIAIHGNSTECFRPFCYFIFISLLFFYWCRMGNRLAEKVRRR